VIDQSDLNGRTGYDEKKIRTPSLSRMSHLPDHSVFREAIADLACVGVRVEAESFAEATPYAVISGRSNARWWLVPLESGKLTAISLALFQPTLTSARCLKWVTTRLAMLGLGRVWARRKIYVTGFPPLANYFPAQKPLVFAYFTGTNSPHRKVAVQVMDRGGELKGFVKLTRNPEVRKLLSHEKATLQRVGLLSLESAHVPKVLFHGDCESVTLLVTDTLKTSRTASTNTFTVAHQAFILELARKTSISKAVSVGDIAHCFRIRIDNLRPYLETEWQHRLECAVQILEADGNNQLNVGLTHGDFTPWNTFLIGGRLYVFDWEYAEEGLPFTNDLIHFCLNEPRTCRRNCKQKIEALQAALSQSWTGLNRQEITLAITIYLLTFSVRFLERSEASGDPSLAWEAAQETAEMFDAVSLSKAIR